jgi:MoxR-like ATPase
MAGADMVGGNSVEKLEDVIVRSAEQVAGQIRTAKDAISTVIFGQDRVIENTLVTILSGGHALLIGVPGLAKTKLVETLGITLGLDAKRIQFTPDLMPSDILGAEVLDESSTGKRSFRFISGPVFAQLLMADEINRRCCRPCRNSTSPWQARATICQSRSMCWRHKIRWSRKAPIRCRKRNSTAS